MLEEVQSCSDFVNDSRALKLGVLLSPIAHIDGVCFLRKGRLRRFRQPEEEDGAAKLGRNEVPTERDATTPRNQTDVSTRTGLAPLTEASI